MNALASPRAHLFYGAHGSYSEFYKHGFSGGLLRAVGERCRSVEKAIVVFEGTTSSLSPFSKKLLSATRLALPPRLAGGKVFRRRLKGVNALMVEDGVRESMGLDPGTGAVREPATQDIFDTHVRWLVRTRLLRLEIRRGNFRRAFERSRQAVESFAVLDVLRDAELCSFISLLCGKGFNPVVLRGSGHRASLESFLARKGVPFEVVLEEKVFPKLPMHLILGKLIETISLADPRALEAECIRAKTALGVLSPFKDKLEALAAYNFLDEVVLASIPTLAKPCESEKKIEESVSALSAILKSAAYAAGVSARLPEYMQLLASARINPGSAP